MTDVDADALKDLVRRANFLPYLSYGSPHDLSILEKISGYYVVPQLGDMKPKGRCVSQAILERLQCPLHLEIFSRLMDKLLSRLRLLS